MSSLSVKFQVHKVDISTLKSFKEAQIPIPGSIINQRKEYRMNSYSRAYGTDLWSVWPNDLMA